MSSQHHEPEKNPKPDPVQAHLDAIIAITTKAESEIEKERKHFDRLLNSLTKIFTFGMIVFAGIYGGSIWEAQNKLNTKLSDMESLASDRINTALNTDNVNSKISTGINDKISSITQQMIDKKVTDSLSPTINEIDFDKTLVLASRYDRAAFDKLLAIFASPDNPHASDSLTILLALASDPEITGFIGAKPNFEKIGIDVDKDSIELVKEIWMKPNGAFRPLEAPSILQAIWDSKHYTIYEKLDFMSFVIKTNPFMQGVAAACRIMDNEAKLNKNIISYKNYLQWWDEHKNDAKYHPVVATP